ncbi:MAG: LpxD N-terminal domain-containing protein, partial [Plesiomonas sp.]
MSGFRLADLAEHLGATVHGDGDTVISGIAALDNAQAGQITFLSNSKYRTHLAQ